MFEKCTIRPFLDGTFLEQRALYGGVQYKISVICEAFSVAVVFLVQYIAVAPWDDLRVGSSSLTVLLMWKTIHS